MEKTFPIILSELRKERGMSQKEAAAALGISQALLSHYEKGIRECGQSFLIKVADFYGVSTDYLLGRSTKRRELQEIASDIFRGDDFTESTGKKMVEAASIIKTAMSDGNKSEGVHLDILLAIMLYKILIVQANAGNLPKNWAGRACINGEVKCNYIYLNLIESCSVKALNPKFNPNPVPDEPIPEPIEVLVKTVEEFIAKNTLELVPPVPQEYLI